jgi:hypothetical protein
MWVFSKVNTPCRSVGIELGVEETSLCLHNSKGGIMVGVKDENIGCVISTVAEEPIGTWFLTIPLTAQHPFMLGLAEGGLDLFAPPRVGVLVATHVEEGLHT